MTALRLLMVLGASLACGCTAFVPFPTVPASAAPGVVDARQRVGLCFNTLKTPPEQVQQAAQTECLGKTVAERVGAIDYGLDVCPLAVPGRVTFVCTPK